ncbi:MAG: hypothetical protein JXR96_01990 [Deltaproteobacteria bacterium]|nr:hypothetical protein [Deltaproteobacteria bacterium]
MRSLPNHHEVLITLAEEIRQLLAWLGQQESPPEADSIRFRLLTLREAATVAGLGSVEKQLAELESKLDRKKGSPLGVEEVLERLSGLIVSLAEPAERAELEWLGQLEQAERDLDQLSRVLDHGARRLGSLGLQADSHALSPDAEMALELGGQLRIESEQLRSCRRQAMACAARLHRVARRLGQELAVVHRVPLAPTLLRLRERCRRWGREHTKPVSLQYQCGRLEVGFRQFEPLARILEALLEQILAHGLDDPAKRRKLGKATVASIRIEGRQEASLLVLDVWDDGLQERPAPQLDKHLREDVSQLRGRIWKDLAASPGQHLVIELPVWHSSLEAIPVETEIGSLWVPLRVVERILTRSETSDLSVLHLDRRTEASAPADEGLVCRIGSWQAILPGHVTGPAQRVVPSQAAMNDPPWATGRIRIDGQEQLLFHPLPFANIRDEGQRLYPEP